MKDRASDIDLCVATNWYVYDNIPREYNHLFVCGRQDTGNMKQSHAVDVSATLEEPILEAADEHRHYR